MRIPACDIYTWLGLFFLLQTVVVLKRKWPIPLVKKDKPVTTRKLREKHYIYEVVRNEDNIPIPPIKCILTRHVDGELTANNQFIFVYVFLRHNTIPKLIVTQYWF